MRLPRSADVVVVGAGVMGASIALHLARRRAGRIVVLDRGEVGQGMSGRSSALVRMHYSLPQEVALAVLSLDMFRHWDDLTGRTGDFRETGFVRIVPASERDRLERNVEMQRRLGVVARVVGADELRELEPDWHVEDDVAAAYEPGSGYGDGAGAASDMLAAARERGVVYSPGTRVDSLLLEAGRCRGVVTGTEHLAAGAVVLAIGPWSAPLLAPTGFDTPIEPEFHQVAILKNPPGLRGRGVACIDSPLQLYYRREGPDMTLVGDFYGRRGVDPDDFPQAVSQQAQAEMCEGLIRRVPRLADAGVLRGVTGVYDMTPDARPLLGEVPGAQGLFLVAGFSGMGFKIAPAVGLAVAERVADGRAASADIDVFRPGRFAAGEPIRADWEYTDD